MTQIGTHKNNYPFHIENVVNKGFMRVLEHIHGYIYILYISRIKKVYEMNLYIILYCI